MPLDFYQPRRGGPAVPPDSRYASCQIGHHSLETILECPTGIPNRYRVVRWCAVCGAIVVDLDGGMEGRSPGKVAPLRRPWTALLDARS